ncbi:MAG: kynureninase [Ignavibacteria bacterium]|nr:kynureninase [Ignavibacteria bacterium]
MIHEWNTEATALDQADELRDFRNRFYIPEKNGKQAIYLAGNSLGLQPRMAERIILEELEDWRVFGVEGHMNSRRPWYSYHKQFCEPLAELVGGLPVEVVAMNALTVNLHLMLISFYRPTPTRYKVAILGNEFPSDRYAIESQIRLHGYDPREAMIEFDDMDDDAILRSITVHADTLALVHLSAVHYYTGKFFDVETITHAAHDAGAYVGFDLAHAIGNVELNLHQWNVDYAVWCSYKYLNSGPGSVGGAFIHEKHVGNGNIPRLAGWWGTDEDTRFEMHPSFVPTYGAESWQLSNAPVFSMAAHKASLDIFREAGMKRVSAKRELLTGFAERVILDAIGNRSDIRIITPSNILRRGAQLSLELDTKGNDVYNALIDAGLVVDWRNPNVIRIAPVPLYNTFGDVAVFGEELVRAIT